MSMLCNDAISYLPERASTRHLAAFAHDRVAPWPAAHSGGYAFETALCLVESQSPRLRPAMAQSVQDALATVAMRQTRELSSRVLLLSKLLDGVRGHLDADDSLVLLTTAGEVAAELIAVFGPGAEGLSIDPSVVAADRRTAADALARAEILLERIRSDLIGAPAISAAA